MAVRDDFLGGVLEDLHELGAIEARRMFGGFGLYFDGVFFGLCAKERLFFKVDQPGAEECLALGLEAFGQVEPPSGEKAAGKYFAVPATVLADPKEKRRWFDRAVAQARQSRAAKKVDRNGLSGLRNIGPVSRRWLVSVGVNSRADLERRGAVEIWKAVREEMPRVSLNLLYALEGARLDRRWNDLSVAERESLKQRAGVSG